MEVATMAEVQPAHPRASGVIGMGGNGGSDSAHFITEQNGMYVKEKCTRNHKV